MAEGVLFNIAEGLIERLGSHAFQEIGLIWGVNDELEKLQQIVTQVKAVLLDAEQKQANNQIKTWLQSLEEVIYDADDVLDAFYCEGQRRKMVPGNNEISNQVCIFFSSSNQLAFRLKMGHKIKQIRERLDGIASLRTKFLFEERSEETQLITRGRETYSFVPMDKIIGRDEDKKAVIQLLLDTNSEENVSTISIVGFGGLGKTALAQLVFNDEVVQKHFELKMWTCVSNVFELNIIVKKIIESATNKTPDQNHSIEQLQKDLREKIDRKKYLLVLDDVWNQDREKWLGLKELLMGGAKGSRILITTRSKIVAEVSDSAKPYILGGLDEKQSWSLFKKMAFKEEKELENVTIKEIAEEIARKCCGVPLFIRTVGPMLYGKHEESDWLAFKNNKLPKISQKENKILLTLKLSYDVLPSHLKHCFGYCSLFPPDYKIDVEELVKLWMAQGFIKSSDENECLEDVGYGYFKELLWRSFFQEETKDEFGMIISCKMHDLMNELAISVSGTVSTIIDRNRENFDEKYRHVSLNFYVDLSEWKIPSSLLKANKIRSFLFLRQGYSWFFRDPKGLSESFCNTICSNFKSLRMLSLNGLGLSRVPKCLSKMRQLRYLNLGYNYDMTRLPNWVVKLENLQTLDLSYCMSLEELPRDLKNMINLRHLMLSNCYDLSHMPCGLGELMCLRTLDRFVLSRRQDKDSAGLGELKKLNELRGRLEIANLRHVKYVSNIMNEKRHLASLTLEWIDEDEVNMDDEEDMSLEALQPHSNLKELVVWCYGGVKFASWLSLLKNIVNLNFYYLPRCEYLPPLDHLPCLKVLRLLGFDSLEYISDEEGWVDSDASSSTSTLPFFPSLDKLIIQDCFNLKGWWRPAGRRDQHQSFPCLSTLHITHCPCLTSMPLYPSLDKELTLQKTSLKPFQETMMMKMKMENEDDNHTASDQHPCFGFSFRGASNISSSTSSPLSKLKSLQIGKLDDKDIGGGGVSKGIGKLTSLESLSIGDSPNLASLPQGILGGLISLQQLKIENCPNLASLPEVIGERSSLQRLEITHCSKLTSLPEGIGMLSSLQSLTIRNCYKLTSLPEGIGMLSLLQSLTICNCDNLISLPQGIGMLSSLQNLAIYNCDNLTSLPEGIGMLSLLQSLTIRNCDNLISLPQGIGNLSSLQNLAIYNCDNLASLPQGIGNLSSLHLFEISFCNNFTSFPESIGNLKSLETFQIKSMHNLTSLPEGIGNLASLRELRVYQCENLTSLPQGIGNLTSLRELRVFKCENLTSLPQGIGNLTSLHSFEISYCKNFTSFPESIGNLKSLETFEIKSMHNLTSLPEGIGNLASLRKLNVENCENLTSLPQGMRRLTSLNTLQLIRCSTLLKKRCKKETGEDWPKIAHIPNLHIWPPIEKESKPGAGRKILSAFKTLMHCN